MTTPTPHGQVLEALIDLIDAYAETHHHRGSIYNAKTEAARNAVIEALSGVQALSAAPAVPTSVKGAMWFTKKPVTIQAIQWTGENLREVITFTDGPPDTRTTHAGMAWEAYTDLVARDGLKIYTLEGKMLASPGDWIIRGVKGEYYPCKDEIFRLTYAAAPATPPAEQQAAPKAAPGEPPGIQALMCVISSLHSLRDTAHFSDEEGELTNDLCTLRDWAYAQTAAFQPAPTAQAAESVPAREHDLQDVRCECCGYMTYHREHMGCIHAARAPADSVQEDAARLDWLEQNLFHREKDEWDTKFGGYKEYNMWVLFSPKGIHGSARNIIDAAREQGADHDR